MATIRTFIRRYFGLILIFVLVIGTAIVTFVMAVDLGLIDNSESRHDVHRSVASGQLLGLSKEEIVAKYGAPVITKYFKDWDMHYIIGPSEGFAVDNKWLVIRLSNDHVVEAAIVED